MVDDTEKKPLKVGNVFAGEDSAHNMKNSTRLALKNLCIKTKALALGRLGNEKMRVERGAAINVSIKDPTKSPGILPIPKEIAPSSRNGKTTKYALNTKKKDEVE